MVLILLYFDKLNVRVLKKKINPKLDRLCKNPPHMIYNW